MDASTRIERALEDAVARISGEGAPARLAQAVRYAVFPGGARIRPRLCLTVAAACGVEDDPLVDAAAASIELMHCASLVHDDLPCFDDAPTRRGRPSLHRAFGEPIAVLAGDAMIVLAFDTLVEAGVAMPSRLAELIRVVARASGMPAGIVAGQGWECEPHVGMELYQREKTAALFAAAASAGGAAAGSPSPGWAILGERLGEAFQVADDIRDVCSTSEEIGKPTGQDAAHGRPNAVRQLGLDGAVRRVEELVQAAMAAAPRCARPDLLEAALRADAARLLPRNLSTAA
jgi:geranylgeranyl diphosphate synthase, type II